MGLTYFIIFFCFYFLQMDASQ
ncbi:hypothetical protein Gogos_018001, partial [Gossypium gossypioides]|nr:hypothetical protein [Gossypium gossypioides]